MTSPRLTPADRKGGEPAKVNGVSGVSAKIDLTDATNVEPVTVARSSHPTHWDGSLEKADHDEISGWVCNLSRPNEAVDVEIMDGDAAILTVCADQFRPDLVAVTGNGCHGFSLKNLSRRFPLSRHSVRVRHADTGQDLAGSPCWITQPWLDHQAVDFMHKRYFRDTRSRDAGRPDPAAG